MTHYSARLEEIAYCYETEYPSAKESPLLVYYNQPVPHPVVEVLDFEDIPF